MIGKNVKSKKPMCLADCEEVLSERKRGGELGFEQKSALAYCERFGKLEAEDAGGLMEDLGAFEKLDGEARVKIIDVLPEYASQVRIIAQKGKIELSGEDVEGILKAVKKYLEASREFQEKKEEKRKEKKAMEEAEKEKELAEEKEEAGEKEAGKKNPEKDGKKKEEGEDKGRRGKKAKEKKGE